MSLISNSQVEQIKKVFHHLGHKRKNFSVRITTLSPKKNSSKKKTKFLRIRMLKRSDYKKTSNETELKVEYFEDNVLTWSGFILPDFFSREIGSPNIVRMTASDRLTALKGVTLSDLPSRVSLRNLIELSLEQTGLKIEKSLQLSVIEKIKMIVIENESQLINIERFDKNIIIPLLRYTLKKRNQFEMLPFLPRVFTIDFTYRNKFDK